MYCQTLRATATATTMAVPALATFVAALALPKTAIGFQCHPSHSTGLASIGPIGSRPRRPRRHLGFARSHGVVGAPGRAAHRRSVGAGGSGRPPRASFRDDGRRRLRFSGGGGRIETRPGTNAAATMVRRLAEAWSQTMDRWFRRALLALSTLAFAFAFPASSWASGGSAPRSPSVGVGAPSASSSYHPQNDPRCGDPRWRCGDPSRKDGIVSIRTRRPRGYSATGVNPDYTILSKRAGRSKGAEKRKRAARRISASVLVATLAASSFRASRRAGGRAVRTATPFGRVRNASPLGNGVSIIRVCVALAFDDEVTEGEDGGGGAALGGGLLERLGLEEKELRAKTSIVTHDRAQGSFAHKMKQEALGEYLSNGEQCTQCYVFTWINASYVFNSLCFLLATMQSHPYFSGITMP